MSDNKIVDNLDFDDDIDFDGLDDSDDSVVEAFESEESSEINITLDSENTECTPDLSECADEDETYEGDVEYISSGENENCDEPYEIAVNDNSEKDYYHEAASVSDCGKENNHDKFVRFFCTFNAVAAVLTLCVLVCGIFIGSAYVTSVEAELEAKDNEIAELENKNSILEEDYMAVINTVEEDVSNAAGIAETKLEQGKIIFYDSSVGYSWLPVLSGIEQNTYDMDNFSVDDRYRMTYTVDEEEASYFGIDVSSYQGDIDWQLVKEDGVEFAFLRIGYRGYGEEGKLCPDEFFVQNYDAAHDAGVDLGVYFFSQATSVAEAVEEAEYVLSLLEDRTLEYPIVFDWENIYTGDPEDIPRTDDMMPQTLTLSAIAFCETVKDAGYEAMIYTNKKLATIKYDLRQLSDYPVWLAYYDTELDYYYDFDIWQYGTAQVDGIEGEVDVNIAIIK